MKTKDSLENNTFAEERKQKIINYINQNTKATVLELSDYFSVTAATIRSDLRELNQKGLIRKTHGGAISVYSVNFEPTLNEKSVTRIRDKQIIVKAAAEYISEGSCIALDAGTTCFELAKLLVGYQKLTVITYDLNIASFLDNNSQVRIVMAGGIIRQNHHYTIGEKAVATLQDLNVDLAFIAANGVCPDRGISIPDLETAKLKQVLMRNARCVILLADSSKLNHVSFVNVGEWKDISIFITDKHADCEAVQRIQTKDVEVRMV